MSTRNLIELPLILIVVGNEATSLTSVRHDKTVLDISGGRMKPEEPETGQTFLLIVSEAGLIDDAERVLRAVDGVRRLRDLVLAGPE